MRVFRISAPSVTKLLRVLLLLSIVAPAVIFVVTIWLNYESAFREATRDLLRISEVAREHATRVFESQSFVSERINSFVLNLSADEIHRSEQSVHEKFAAIIARLPQVQSVLLVDRDGTPLASASVYPVPQGVTVRGRDYFEAITGGYAGTYVSSLQVGEVNHQLFFGLGRPWIGRDGTMSGVIDVAVSPSFFQDFYSVVVGNGSKDANGKVVTLIRSDGQILVRYPQINGVPPKAPKNEPFFHALALNPDHGTYESYSIVDAGAPARLFAYRKVDGYPVYVVAGLSRAVLMDGVEATAENDLGFALPVTLALFAITWTALVRAEREENALARANLEVARRQVAEAKRNEAESALLKAQRLEAIGQITGGVAHDFNNLLTIILGGSQSLLRRSDDPTRVRMIAEQMIIAAKRGGEITQKLLAFARRQVTRPEIINPNERLLEFKPLINQAARETVQVELQLDDALGCVELDPGHFEAAILNLVGNARDAMPSGGDIVISTRNITLAPGEHSELLPGPYIRVCVTDNGSGMSEVTAAKAFEPFFTTKKIGEGTGLGLSQVYGFAKQAGGDARIESVAGLGTSVILLLPRTETQLPHGPAADLPDHQRFSDGAVILVVEDEPGVLAMAVETLKDLGFQTVAAPHAQAALDYLEQGSQVDLLFSDVLMPGGMNGFELLTAARRLRPGINVLLTSGYVAPADLNIPADVPLLLKPYDRLQLAERLSSVMQVPGAPA